MTPPPSGNPALKGNVPPKMEARIAKLEERADGHDAHLSRHGALLFEVNKDVMVLADVVHVAGEIARRAKEREAEMERERAERERALNTPRRPRARETRR